MKNVKSRRCSVFDLTGSRCESMASACLCLWFTPELSWTCSPHTSTSFLQFSSCAYFVLVKTRNTTTRVCKCISKHVCEKSLIINRPVAASSFSSNPFNCAIRKLDFNHSGELVVRHRCWRLVLLTDNCHCPVNNWSEKDNCNGYRMQWVSSPMLFQRNSSWASPCIPAQ